MILELNGIDVECIIGERAEERTRTQRLLVDVRLEIGDAAAESDELSDTVDYAALEISLATSPGMLFTGGAPSSGRTARPPRGVSGREKNMPS